jgi:hypothetical protein
MVAGVWDELRHGAKTAVLRKAGVKAASPEDLMAKVIGESARYVSEQAVKSHRHLVMASMIGIGLLGAIVGYDVSLLFKRIDLFVILQMLVLGILMVAIERVTSRRIGKMEKSRNAMRRGMSGEAEVAMNLEALPDCFTVINDLSTPFGNIDHVVVGPTGVYVIDTKNWLGTVTSDGNRELLLNGKPTSKPEVKALLRTVMSIQEKVRALSGLNPYIQAVLAFPRSYVAVANGATKYVHCVGGDRLHDYIADWKPEKKLPASDVAKLVRAFVALASMDAEFDKVAGAKPSRSRTPLPQPTPTNSPVSEAHGLASAKAGVSQ